MTGGGNVEVAVSEDTEVGWFWLSQVTSYYILDLFKVIFY